MLGRYEQDLCLSQLLRGTAMATPLGKYRLKRYLRHGVMPQLAAFYAVVQMGSVTKAADALCVAQPTLSGHLRKLSETLGVQLFEPAGKRLQPTAAALVLVETAEQVFAALERCEEQLDELRAPATASTTRAPEFSSFARYDRLVAGGSRSANLSETARAA